MQNFFFFVGCFIIGQAIARCILPILHVLAQAIIIAFVSVVERRRFGSTMEDFIKNISGQPCEHIAIFNARGKRILGIGSGNSRHVMISPLAARYCRLRKGKIAVHNHPDLDTPFSRDDIITSSLLGLEEHIVVTEAYRYYVRPRHNWGDQATIRDVFSRHVGLMRIEESIEICFGNGKSLTLPVRSCNTHEAMELIAAELDYEYGRETLEIFL